MSTTDTLAPMALTSQMLGMLGRLAQARSGDAALRQADLLRLEIAHGSIFSIQQNMTTAHDPADELQLRRFYSSEAVTFPVRGAKRKTLTPWVKCLFLRGQVFVGEGAHVLASTFDDFDQMSDYGVQSVINVPLMRGNVCYATFNVFGAHPHWQAQQVLGIELLALAVARWIPCAPGLAYRLAGSSFNSSVET
jgi:hypothetical protein